MKVDFVINDGTYFTTGYSSWGTFFLHGYYTDGSSTFVLGASNYDSPITDLTISAPPGKYLDYVVLHDPVGYWQADNMRGDASRIPDPAFSLFLLGAGLVGLAGMRSRWL